MQFLFPVLASKIKVILRSKGYEMKSNPLAAMLNISGFWLEARSLNSEAKSKYVTGLLSVYYFWWFMVAVFMISLGLNNG